jgi:hypothetical protein
MSKKQANDMWFVVDLLYGMSDCKGLMQGQVNPNI